MYTCKSPSALVELPPFHYTCRMVALWTGHSLAGFLCTSRSESHERVSPFPVSYLVKPFTVWLASENSRDFSPLPLHRRRVFALFSTTNHRFRRLLSEIRQAVPPQNSPLGSFLQLCPSLRAGDYELREPFCLFWTRSFECTNAIVTFFIPLCQRTGAVLFFFRMEFPRPSQMSDRSVESPVLVGVMTTPCTFKGSLPDHLRTSGRLNSFPPLTLQNPPPA